MEVAWQIAMREIADGATGGWWYRIEKEGVPYKRAIRWLKG